MILFSGTRAGQPRYRRRPARHVSCIDRDLESFYGAGRGMTHLAWDDFRTSMLPLLSASKMGTEG